MLRACKLTLKFITAAKRQTLDNLLEAYRSAVNFYIVAKTSDDNVRLDGKSVALLIRTRLSYRYKNAALRQALGIVASWQSNGSKGNVPAFNGGATLSDKFVNIEESERSSEFDIFIRLSTLNKGDRIVLPTKKTAVLNRWLAFPGATLVQGCTISEDYVIVWVKIPNGPYREEGDEIGIDTGIVNVLATSDGEFIGEDFRNISDKVRRRQPGSNGKRRASIERDQYLNWCVNRLPWNRIKVIGHENLKHLKTGKKKNRGKSFRKALAPWTYCRVLTQIGQKAEANRVRCVAVPPAYTSQECPVCGKVSSLNRRGEKFKCVACGHEAHADTTGALNIIARTRLILGSVVSPRLTTNSQ